MSTYTLSPCLLEKCNSDLDCYTEILMRFIQNNEFKVAHDKSGRIIELYKKQVNEKNEYARLWLDLMYKKFRKFELINIEIDNNINDEELLLVLSSFTKSQHVIIKYSHEDWNFINYNLPNIIQYNNKKIQIFDRDESIKIFSNNLTLKIENLFIADNKSKIKKININKHEH